MRPCIFCEIVAKRAPSSRVLEDERFVSFLDIHPASPGHALVIPRRHVVEVAELGDDVGDLFALASRVATALRAALGCAGVNLLLNDGRAANQTVPHAHVHVIPRRGGDLGAVIARTLLHHVRGAAPRAELDRVAATVRSAAARG